jgi:3,4-dihydroxy 2-butanone 4-phosphate synthase / GTP cyclohydrolase II
VFRSDVDGGEHLALVKGDVRGDEATLVRAHAEYLPGDVFGSADRNTGALLHRAMEIIAGEGRGIVLYLKREQGSEMFAPRGESPSTRSEGGLQKFREYGIGAQILRALGVRKIRLISNFSRRLISLPGYGLEIVETVPLDLPTSRGSAREP